MYQNVRTLSVRVNKLVQLALVCKNLTLKTKRSKLESYRLPLEAMCDGGMLHEIAVKHLDVLDSALNYIETGDDSHLRQCEAHYEQAAELMGALSEKLKKID